MNDEEHGHHVELHGEPFPGVVDDGDAGLVGLLLDGGGPAARDEVREAEDGDGVDDDEADEEEDREVRPFHVRGAEAG
jgi:hypothetical protein